MSAKLQKALEILNRFNTPKFIIERNNHNMRKIMTLLNNPHNSTQFIHITGTNGKGSVALKTACILEKGGYKVGLYTSPHIFSFRERIKVNRQDIMVDSIADKIIFLDSLSDRYSIKLSYFQYLTASAFLHFKEMKCDFVSLEVGLGGRNDTTNVVDPLASVITSVGLDHTDILGPSIQNIGWEKAGIIKHDRPVVLGSTAQLKVIEDYASKMNSKVIKVISKEQDFEKENIATTQQVISTLQSKYGLKVPESALKEGIVESQPCRMEMMIKKWKNGKKKVYFDVAHNPQAISRSIEYLKNRIASNEKVTVVFGSSRNKKAHQSLSLLEDIAQNIYLISPNHQRAMLISELEEGVLPSKKYRRVQNGEINKTLKYVMEEESDVVLICGSFFIMKEAKTFFNPRLSEGEIDESLSECATLHQKIESF